MPHGLFLRLRARHTSGSCGWCSWSWTSCQLILRDARSTELSLYIGRIGVYPAAVIGATAGVPVDSHTERVVDACGQARIQRRDVNVLPRTHRVSVWKRPPWLALARHWCGSRCCGRCRRYNSHIQQSINDCFRELVCPLPNSFLFIDSHRPHNITTSRLV